MLIWRKMVNVLQQSSSDCRLPRAGDMEVQDIPNLLKRGHPKPKASVAIYKLQFTNLLFTSHLFISSSSRSQAEQHLALCTPWCPSTVWNRRDLIQCLVGQTFPGQRAQKDSITVEIRHSQPTDGSKDLLEEMLRNFGKM